MANPLDLSWRRYGACKGKPVAWWYPVSADVDDRALEVCEGCPVKQACLAWAIEHEDHGVWAGTSERERRRIRQRAGIRLDSPSLSPYAVDPIEVPA